LAAVVLVPGSGPQDRDATLGPNKPFRDLAWGLSSRGLAVLRYEKRTKQHAATVRSTLGHKLTLKEELVDDALRAVQRLRAVPRVAADKIFVLGYSLGAIAIPRIARRDDQLAGFVIMAGTTRPLEDVLLMQMRHLCWLDGELNDDERAVLAKLQTQRSRVKNLAAGRPVPANSLPLGLAPAYWLDLAAHRPAALLAREYRPVLVLHGDRDYQVSLIDLRGWQTALRHNRRARIKRYRDLNHLFMAGEGPNRPTEYQLPGHVAAQVIADIANWIRRQAAAEAIGH